jgi:tRNA (guanine-N7-)-methyltransferase
MSQYKSEQEAEQAGVRLRKITSFVLREGRLTKGQQQALDNLWPEMGIEYQHHPYSLSSLFGRTAPVVIEIGFGMGKSLVEMAVAQPEKNFIGIEVHRPGIGACLAAAKNERLNNLRLFNHDAVEVLRDCIHDNSLDGLQLYFPDPWRKKRHHKRRIVQPEFVALVCKKLKVGGYFHMATDWQAYAEHMLSVIQFVKGFTNTSSDNTYIERPDFRPLTKFEQRGQRLQHGVWDLLFLKTQGNH